MSFQLAAKRIDFHSGEESVVLLHEDVAVEHGINPGDHIVLSQENKHEFICIVNTAIDEIDKYHIGLYEDIYRKHDIKNEAQILITLLEKPKSVEYIREKIKRHALSYDQIEEIIKNIVDGRLGIIEKTYFLSTIYNPGYSDDELYYITKAMADTGDVMKFEGIVGDKHSIGGVAGKGITPIVVSIAASYGIKIPNTSTRSITTPAGTTDILETVTKIAFSQEELKAIIDKINCCMVWGGGLNLAPADDELIRVERPLDIESFDKFIVSIIAKKVAIGITHLLIDIPAGPEYKVNYPQDIEYLKNKFISIGARFGIKVLPQERFPKGIDGNGVGPKLEMREVLYVLEQQQERSLQLEEEAVKLAGMLLELCEKAQPGNGSMMAKEALQNGSALKKFKEIIVTQGGSENITAVDMKPTSQTMLFKAVVEGTLTGMKNKKVIELARILGCPLDKSAGIYFYKKLGDKVMLHEPMFSIYATAQDRLRLALAYLQKNNLFIFEQ